MVSKNSDTIKLKDLPLNLLLSSAFKNENKVFSNEELYTLFEKAFLSRVLKKANFSLDLASKILNISPNNLSSKIESLEIS